MYSISNQYGTDSEIKLKGLEKISKSGSDERPK